jgi:L-ascorbate metabolism protein UlaG (beta-lactamase superfamily)
VPRYPVSDHCDGERFFNPHARARPLSDVIKWMRTREKRPWPLHVPLQSHPAPPAAVAPGRVAVTFIGHSTFLIRTASAVILTDPVFTTHAGPFGRSGPRRVRPPAIAPAALPPVDLVLVSHNHYDHLQPSSLRLFADRASYIAPLGVSGQLGLPSRDPVASSREPVASAFRRKIHELDWWQTMIVGAAEITCVPAQHFSARTPFDRDKTLWCGFVVRVDGATIYFAGDSGYSPHFVEIATRYPSIDVALLPIGAYEPRWFMGPVHMNPDDAVRAHLDVRARVSIGMHFGTFQLTDEPIDQPVRALEAAKCEHGADTFRVLDFGESVIL